MRFAGSSLSFLLGLATAPVTAQPPATREDIQILVSSAEAVQTYEQSGMAELGRLVTECHSSISEMAAPEKARRAQDCIVLDMSAAYLDFTFFFRRGIPADPRYEDAAVMARIRMALSLSEQPSSLADAQAYFNARVKRVDDYTGRAVTVLFPMVEEAPGASP